MNSNTDNLARSFFKKLKRGAGVDAIPPLPPFQPDEKARVPHPSYKKTPVGYVDSEFLEDGSPEVYPVSCGPLALAAGQLTAYDLGELVPPFAASVIAQVEPSGDVSGVASATFISPRGVIVAPSLFVGERAFLKVPYSGTPLIASPLLPGEGSGVVVTIVGYEVGFENQT